MIRHINTTPNYFALPGYNMKVKFMGQKQLPDVIIDCTCDCFMITRSDIMKRDRSQQIVLARQTAMYIIYDRCCMSKSAIAGIFNMDHTTVIHSQKLISDLLEVDHRYKKIYAAIDTALSNQPSWQPRGI